MTDAPAIPPVTFAELARGALNGPRWSQDLLIDQQTTTAFGHLTLDPDLNHIDADWAAAHSPFGGPIVFGFQSLAMLTFLGKSAGVIPPDATHVVNYGFDRVRFVSPTPVGSIVRGRFDLAEVKPRRPGQILVTYDVQVFVQDAERPALAALWLALYEGEPAA